MADPADELTPDEIEEFKGLTRQEINAELSDAPSFNPAVYRCMRACNRAIKKRKFEIGMDEDDEGSVRSAAKSKYLRSMPPLDSCENVRDFIACVTFAEVLGLILHHETEGLLSSARTALAAVRLESKSLGSQPKRLGRPPKSRLG
jgi:hypothetical protein